MDFTEFKREEMLSSAELVKPIGPYDIAILKADPGNFLATIWHYQGNLQALREGFTSLALAMEWALSQVRPLSNVGYVNEVFGGTERHPVTLVWIMLPVAPVSFQKSRSRRDEIIALIRSVTKDANFILTNNVAVGITWFLHEKEIYESDAPPDVDNIVKPILDALCGPEGILIDDCQVQSLSSCRVDWHRPGQCFEIEVEFYDTIFLFPKKGLIVRSFLGRL